jgi:hypothetical protein
MRDGIVERLRTFVFERKFHLFSDPLGFLDELLQNDSILYESFDRQFLFVRGVPFITADRHLTKAEITPSLLTSLSTSGAGDVVQCDRLANFTKSVVYSVPKVFLEEIGLYFSKAEILHGITGLICSQQPTGDTDVVLSARISAHWLEIAVMEGRSLLFVNQFQWTDPADILYYVSAVIDELDISVRKYVLCGSHSEENFRDRLASEFDIARESIELRQVPGKRLMDLSGLTTCV